MENKQLYEEKFRAELEKWTAEINRLRAEADSVQSEARQRYLDQIKVLRDKQREAEARIEEFSNAQGKAWKDMTDGIEKSWREMGKAVEKANQRFM